MVFVHVGIVNGEREEVYLRKLGNEGWELVSAETIDRFR